MRDPQSYGRVAVLMGGTAAEREVSLRSGSAVTAALQSLKIDAFAVDFRTREDLIQLLNQCDRVFICLHGRGGEDGTLQGALELLGIPYTGSGVLASALAMDKVRCKRLWQGAGLPTPKWLKLGSELSFQDVVAVVGGPPFMLKPAREGSSIGVAMVNTVEEFEPALATALALDPEVFAETYIRGGEYTAPILDDQALPLVKLEPKRAFYDYTAKYVSNDTVYRCPCGLRRDLETVLQELAKAAFDSLGCRSWGRIDLMLDEREQPFLIEANTVPGMTSASLMPRSAAQADISFAELVERVLASSWSEPSL